MPTNKILFVTKSGLLSLPLFIMCVLFCYISEKEKSWALKKTLFFGVFGFFLFFIPGFLSISQSCLLFKCLSFLGILCITTGFLPYQRFSFLEQHPHKIKIEKDSIIFYFFNSPLLKIKKNIITEIKYLSKRDLFGIQVLITTTNPKTKIVFLEQRKKIINRFLKIYFFKYKENEMSFFFPHFNEESCKKLKQYF